MEQVNPQIEEETIIIQHPGGGPKQIALYHNLITHVDQERVDMGFYFGDTSQQHWITFQNDDSQNNAGLPALAGKAVHRPSYDPE